MLETMNGMAGVFSEAAEVVKELVEEKEEIRSTPAHIDNGDAWRSTPARIDNEEGWRSTPASVEASIFDEIENLVVITEEIQEVAPIMEIQALMIREEFLNIPEVQYETWKELTVEQKVEALQKLEQCAADISLRIPFDVASKDLKYPTLGVCTGSQLIISEHSLEDNSYESYVNTLDTLFHEGRHAYQKYNVAVKQVEQSYERVDAWRENYKCYDNGDRLIFKERGFREYYTQAVEADARVFSECVLRTLEL